MAKYNSVQAVLHTVDDAQYGMYKIGNKSDDACHCS